MSSKRSLMICLIRIAPKLKYTIPADLSPKSSAYTPRVNNIISKSVREMHELIIPHSIECQCAARKICPSSVKIKRPNIIEWDIKSIVNIIVQ